MITTKWPEGSTPPIGHRITWGTRHMSYEIVDITGDEYVLGNPVIISSGEPSTTALYHTMRLGRDRRVWAVDVVPLDKPKTPTGKIVSDGGSSGYYHFPEDAEDLNDLIEYREMSFARGNIFKALFRLGEKEGVDVSYDLNKMQLFLDRLKAMHKAGRRL